MPVSVLRALSLGVHFFLVFAMCSANDIVVLYVTPNILVLCVCGIGVLLRVTLGMVLCSCVSLVSRVTVDFAGATLSLLGAQPCLKSVNVVLEKCGGGFYIVVC